MWVDVMLPIEALFSSLQIVPESPRYYLVHGEQHKAQKVMELIAWYNRKPLPMVRSPQSLLSLYLYIKQQCKYRPTLDCVNSLSLLNFTFNVYFNSIQGKVVSLEEKEKLKEQSQHTGTYSAKL